MAFTLIMCAYSLRTWRRNGVACDELLFLPGTPHGQTHGVEGPPVTATPDRANAATRSEGDVAAGVGWQENTATSANGAPTAVELSPLAVNAGGGFTRSSPKKSKSDSSARRNRLKRSISMDSSRDDDSIQEFGNSWDEYDNTDDDEEELRVPLAANSSFDEQRSLHSINSLNVLEIDGIDEDIEGSPVQGPVQRFRESHPRITMIGSFFFFRSAATSTHNATYAPSGPAVVGAALDLSMPILFNFHLYIEAYNHMEAYGSDTPAKILPLFFLSALIVRSVFPFGKRSRFWSTMKLTFMAPFHRIRFRDAFVGDILTSLVRPCQDILFALSYYVTAFYSTTTGRYSLSECGQILENSWILHNVVLPSCALLPLWWKFLQTLRECYDTGKRWPALGNALKYLTASLVILYGMTHPEDRRSPWWLVSYALTCLYQIWWDTMVDWELFVIAARADETSDCESQWFSQAISSISPNSYFLLTLQRNIFQPIYELSRCFSKWCRYIRHIELRPTRLYKTDSFYWRIFFYNTIFRFAWMLCFIPAYHLSPSGGEHVTTFSSDTNSYIGVLLPVAELLRRALWGFLLLEKETIKRMDGDPMYSRADSRESSMEDSVASLDMMDSSKSARQYLPAWLGNQHQLQHDPSSSSSRFQCFQCDEEMRRKLFITELSLWAVAFVGLGLWATGD
jgi:hypothetical protein